MKYISVLRGINVGGKNKIRMVDLKDLYEESGLENVATYIQSGNVIFDTEDTDIAGISMRIERAIQSSHGLNIPVDVRTREDYIKIHESCPYQESLIEENDTKVLVSFLSGEAASDKISEIESYASLPEQIKVIGNVVYLYCPNGYGRSKLSNNFIESRLGLVATTRNWKTIRKLVELSQ